MTTSTPASGKAAAAAAAKALLADRITLVENLGESIDRHRRKAHAVTAAQTAERDAAQEVRAAFTAAQDGGWTAAELKAAGLAPPRASRVRSRPAAGQGARTTKTPGAETHAHSNPDEPGQG
ncbi:hypothetical protein [Rhodococcus aerolatus]